MKLSSLLFSVAATCMAVWLLLFASETQAAPMPTATVAAVQAGLPAG